MELYNFINIDNIVEKELSPKSLVYINGLNFDYESEYPCNGGCQHDYCHCRVIGPSKVNISSFDDFSESIIKKLKSNGFIKKSNLLKNEVNTYGIEKLLLLHDFNKEELFELESSPGYYGEEADGINHKNLNSLVKDIAFLLSLNSNTSKMEFLLKKEYGEVLDKFKNLDWDVIESPIETVKYIDKVFEDAGRHNEEKAYPLQKPTIQAVCLDMGKFLSLIDGYHRLNQEKTTGKKTIKIIRGSQK